MKISISPSPKAGSKPYSHLGQIIEELINAGNEFSDPLPNFPLDNWGFYMDRDGWKCDLKRPIDFKLIGAKFELPSSILISEKNNSILCQNTWVEIRGGIA